MNFTKYRVTENTMLSEMMRYCSSIISYRREKDEDYPDVYSCISTRTGGVEVRKRNYNMSDDELLLAIRYDVNNDFYYFLEKKEFGIRILENRVIIYDKEDFYTYFDNVINNISK
ncbi:hypothetical protein [Sporosarcina sp. FSL W7-1283]|uniref:hypothetical protein n=1 Tax=Sporosarcina sp. FSL W7-1283 TaxID=2921560 RepID=UPI0030FAE4A0